MGTSHIMKLNYIIQMNVTANNQFLSGAKESSDESQQ